MEARTKLPDVSRLSDDAAKRRYQALMNKGLLVFGESDEMEALAKRLGMKLRWMHLPLIDGVGWKEGRGGE